MSFIVKKVLPLVSIILVVGCGARNGPHPVEPPQSGEGTDFLRDASHAVVVYPAYLRSGPGKGSRIGMIGPNTVVKVGPIENNWRQVELEGEFEVKGWVRLDRIGCRALREVELQSGSEEIANVLLRPGALLAVLGQDGDQLEVETQDPVSRRGTIAMATCGVGEPFVPGFPQGATPFKLLREANMVCSEAHGGGTIKLPAGYRFAVEANKGRNVFGRTDGPIVVQGQIETNAVERDRSTPLDRLAEPLGYSHEILVDIEIRDQPSGEPVAGLTGGTPANPIERGSDWVRIRTHGPVQLEGWLEQWAVRRVALDHNELEPLARRRLHAPIDRSYPRGMDLIEEETP